MFWITIILLFIASVAKALMDISAKDGFTNSWFNKTESWENKYAIPLIKKYKHWYYFGFYTPIYKERFVYSSTLLVFLSDGWHLLQSIVWNIIFICLALNMSGSFMAAILMYFIIRFVFGIGFNLFYK